MIHDRKDRERAQDVLVVKYDSHEVWIDFSSQNELYTAIMYICTTFRTAFDFFPVDLEMFSRSYILFEQNFQIG